ncbi:MAG: L,D-transpeptidase family protein [Moraxella sp.]|nr:L,D-transpeptidase family protein [Moraxella sp.]
MAFKKLSPCLAMAMLLPIAHAQTAQYTTIVNDVQTETIDDQTQKSDGDISYGDVEIPPIGEATTDTSAINSIEKDGKRYTTVDLSHYARTVNESTWSPNMKVNSAMTVKIQALLDWNHASPGPIDGGWGMNSKKALTNFQKIKGLPATGKMDKATWDALTANIDPNQPALVSYTITKDDVNTKFAKLPAGAEARSKLKGLYYENIVEMFGERFHMDVNYLRKLNPNKKFVAGETITVINTGEPFKGKVTRVVADRADKVLYAYNGDKLVAAYPTTVGGSASTTPGGTYKIVNKVKMPHYKATVDKDTNPKSYILPPGPNSPVGVVWMGLSKPSYGIHGSPVPEGISRQASLGCVRLTNWDVLELSANIDVGATVQIK